ncbi:MAG: hypothetical protein ACLRZH_17985 [Ruthenibacterium lactatiformans]
MPYPLVPAQISLLSGLLIGVPSFLLTFEPSWACTRQLYAQRAAERTARRAGQW